MKNLIKVRMFVALLWLALPAAVQAQFKYSNNGNGTCTITNYTGSDEVVTIPSTIDGLTVTSIGTYAFEYSALGGVSIPDTVTNIGYGAFAYCYSLTSVTMGNGVTIIGGAAFYSCMSLETLTLPGSVASIGDLAFDGCLRLLALFFQGNAVPDDGAIFYQSYPTVYYNYGTTGWGTTFSGASTATGFYPFAYSVHGGAISITKYFGSGFGNDIVAAIIPNTLGGLPVTSIVTNSFANSGPGSVTIPGSVTNIGGHAFEGCYALTAVFFQGNAPHGDGTIFNFTGATVYYTYGATGWGSTFGGVPTAMYSYPFGYTIHGGAATITKYLGNDSAVIIPDTLANLPVTSVGSNAFYQCSSLINVTIPTSVTNIGYGAFGICTSLTNVMIPGSVTSIGDNAFLSCYSLASINIPNSVTRIGADTFSGTALTSVTIPGSVTNIGKEAFNSCYRLTSVTIGKGVTNFADYAFDFCTNLTTVFFQGNAPPDDGTMFQGDPATVYYLPGATGWGSNFGGAPAVLWNPRAVAAGVAGGHFGFSITGPANALIVVESTASLVDPVWIPVGTNTLSASGMSSFADPQSGNYPSRYYRFRPE